MKTVYLVTEGVTDQIVLAALITTWLGDSDFLLRYVQPPESAYAEGLRTRLSEGWRGVVAWCSGGLGAVSRDEVVRIADCAIIHVDADVASDPEFSASPFAGPCPPATPACDHIRVRLIGGFGGMIPDNVVLCIPSQDLEAWVLSALHPEVADKYEPIECHAQPGRLLALQKMDRLVRSSSGRLRKISGAYRGAAEEIVKNWDNCTSGDSPRCPEAVRFEIETRRALGL
jgi:hypothetical protein